MSGYYDELSRFDKSLIGKEIDVLIIGLPHNNNIFRGVFEEESVNFIGIREANGALRLIPKTHSVIRIPGDENG